MNLTSYELDELINLIQYEIDIMSHILKMAAEDDEFPIFEKELHKRRLVKLLDTKFKLVNMRYHNEAIMQ